MKANRNWKPHYDDILTLYKNGHNATEIAKIYHTKRTTIKNIIANLGKLRTQSEAAILVHAQAIPKTFNCIICQREVISKAPRLLYCSSACQEKARPESQKTQFTCKFCGNIFKRRASNNMGLYCSRECSGLDMIDKTPNPYKTIAFLHYPAKCNICEIDDLHTLVVHHKNHNETDNRVENLQILCANCHLKHHTQSSTDKEKMLDRILKYKSIKGIYKL
jgi:transcription elongation factor Elf1